MRIDTGALADRARASLFVVPMGFVLAGAALGVAGLAVDDRLGDERLPIAVASTVDSARAVLSTVASATMTVAGIAFSVALLVFQLSSSQYSPRVIHGLFRDEFNKRVMGVVLGTFTYCLVVLRSVHGSVDAGPDRFVPTVSVSVAVLLGVVSVLAIVAFIDHNAHRMDVSEILQGVTTEAKRRVDQCWPDAEPDAEHAELPPDAPTGPGHTVPASRDGWVQRLDHQGLLAALPPGGTIRVDVTPGRYAVQGTPVAAVWPAPEDVHATRAAVDRAITIGDSRTLLQDPTYGLRQLADVALRALSPGVNDPTTAQDAIFHLAAVLHEMLRRRPPDRTVLGHDGRRLLVPGTPGHREAIELAFDEIRRSAATLPTVCGYLLEAIRLAGSGLEDAGRAGHEARDALAEQARLVVADCERADLAPWDLATVRRAYQERFGALDDPVDVER